MKQLGLSYGGSTFIPILLILVPGIRADALGAPVDQPNVQFPRLSSAGQ
jgi:hypothetical protein